jgi:uncharacterized RDD family membrane protein YckC
LLPIHAQAPITAQGSIIMSGKIPPDLNAPTGAALSPIPTGAGFGIRLGARLIDSIYGFILGSIVGFMGGILFAILSHLGRISPDWTLMIKQHRFSGFGLSILGAFLYFAVSEGIGSVTIGKLICGLRVVQMDGGPVTMKGALIRELGYFIDALFFGLVAYNSMQKGPLNQRYGDVWGKTVVVKTSDFQPHAPRNEWRMIEGITLGSLLWGAILFLQTVVKVI